MLFKLLLVACGGFFGSIARFWISNELNKHLIGTWLANITGSLLLAIIFRLYVNELVSDSIWLFVGVGYCGAYTTFSTFGKETITLLVEKEYVKASLYVIGSLFISFVFVVFVVIW